MPSVLLVAAWAGALTGLVEVFLRLVIQQRVLGKSLFFGPHFVWMAPVADALLFAGAAALLLALGRVHGGLRTPRAALFLVTFLFAVSLALLYPGLHRLAAVVLGAGLALQASRILAPRAQSVWHLARRSGPWVGAVVLALALGVSGWRSARAWQAERSLPAATSDAPNVLLLVLDTVRAQSMGLYGYARPTTPSLDRWAREGVVFEQAISTAPWTPPSHASLFTGRYPHELFAKWDAPLGRGVPTLAEALRDRGYRTAGFVANIEYAGYEQGLDRGFLHWEDYRVSAAELVLSSSLAQTMANSRGLRWLLDAWDILGRKDGGDVNRAFLDWVGDGDGDRPFFAFLNYYEAHEPYLPPAPYDTLFGSPEPRKNWKMVHWKHQAKRVAKRKMSAAEVRAERDAYDGAIAALDAHLGALFRQLSAGDGEGARKTVVILTADHGEQFGEHGWFTHANTLYRQVLHVPLVIHFPSRAPAGFRVREAVSLRDVPATIMDLAGVEGAPFPGASLARAWKSGAAALTADTLLSEFAGQPASTLPRNSRKLMKSVHAGTLHYIRNGDGTEEVYDYRRDPLEETKLPAKGAAASTLEPLRAWLRDVKPNAASR
ncbi:MAG: sulfatase-like hydrolase/transferase [Gemmatimonadetes bacterium]|nr:sulfatase-like hydrolase/transferase [Gemmatimonadota bacterium]